MGSRSSTWFVSPTPPPAALPSAAPTSQPAQHSSSTQSRCAPPCVTALPRLLSHFRASSLAFEHSVTQDGTCRRRRGQRRWCLRSMACSQPSSLHFLPSVTCSALSQACPSSELCPAETTPGPLFWESGCWKHAEWETRACQVPDGCDAHVLHEHHRVAQKDQHLLH